jgi:hypothetical protein
MCDVWHQIGPRGVRHVWQTVDKNGARWGHIRNRRRGRSGDMCHLSIAFVVSVVLIVAEVRLFILCSMLGGTCLINGPTSHFATRVNAVVHRVGFALAISAGWAGRFGSG